MAERVVDRFEVVEVDAQRRHAAAVARDSGEHLLHAFAQQHAIWQPRKSVVTGHERDARLRALPLGDIHGGHHHCIVAVIVEAAGEDGDIDRLAAGLAMGPRAPRLLFLRDRVEGGKRCMVGPGMNPGKRAADQRVTVKAVMGSCRLVDREDCVRGLNLSERQLVRKPIPPVGNQRRISRAPIRWAEAIVLPSAQAA